MPPSNTQYLPALQANPWFGGLPPSEQRAMLDCAQPLRLPRGAVLYRKGHPECAFYGIVKGLVKISSLAPDGREGILALIEAGNWFSESTLLDGQDNPYDATVVEDVQLLVIDREGFQALMLRQPFAAAMARLEAQRLRAVFSMVEDTMLRDMRTRVARRLLVLAHGDATMAAQARARVQVSQDALAMMLGVTRQTLAKELKVLVDTRVLALGYGRIDILDVPALQRLAEPG